MPKAEVSGTSSPALDRARGAGLDDLFTVRPEAFVAARNALADSLKRSGDKEAAAAVRSLGKPPLSVWVANQVARQQKETLAQLLEVSDQLRAVQQGQAGDLRALSERHRELLKRLRGHAAKVLELPPSGSSSHLDRAQATLIAAASGSKEQQQALAAGQLQEEVAAAGFSVFGGFGGEAPGVSAGKAKVASSPPVAAARDRGGKASTRPVAVARDRSGKGSAPSPQEARAAQQQARAAAREAQAAELQAQRAAEAREALDRAQREAAASGRALQEAEAAEASAEQGYQEARARREAASAALKAARSGHQQALRQVERLTRNLKSQAKPPPR